MRERPHNIARNAALALTGQLVTAAVTAGLTLYLARALGPDEFGVFSLALAIASTLVLVSDFGVSQSAARFAAEHREQPDQVAEVLASALRLKLWLAGGVCVALALLAGPIADAYDQPTLAWALRAMAVALYGQNLMGLYGGAFVALARVDLDLRIVLVKSLVEAAATIALVLATAGAAEAALGRAAGFVVGGALAVALGARLLGRQAIGLGAPQRVSTRRIAGYAGALFVIDGAFALFQQIDVLLIGAILTASAAGLFQAPLRLITFLGYPAQAMANGVAPHLAGPPEIRRVGPFEAALRYTLLFQVALVPPVLVWADPIVELLLGSEYTESAGVLRALAPYVLMLGVGTLLAYSVNYVGEARRRVPAAIASITVNFVIDLVLIPEIGILGGAVGTDVAFGIYTLAHLWICKRVLDVALRPLAMTLVRGLLAAAAMAAVLALFGTADVGVPALLGGGALGLVVYVAGLLALRETSFAEVSHLGGRVGTLLGRQD